MNPEKTTVIINPAAAAGRVGKRREAIERSLREHLGHVRVLYTERSGHAIDLARGAVEGGATSLLSLGGDGTHSEVVNGIMGASPEPGAVALGILPAGTGGDFKRLLRNSADVEASTLALRDAEAFPIDVGSLRFRGDGGGDESRFFLNVTSFGIGGLVDRLVNESPKALGGRISFLVGTLRAMLHYRPAKIRLWVDDALAGEYEVTNIVVCNGRFAAGGMMFAPEARLADGLFDVVIVKHASYLRTLTLSGTIYRGTHTRSSLVEIHRGRKIRAETVSDNPAYIDVDGEPTGTLPIEFTVLPGAIRLYNPRPDVL